MNDDDLPSNIPEPWSMNEDIKLKFDELFKAVTDNTNAIHTIAENMDNLIKVVETNTEHVTKMIIVVEHFINVVERHVEDPDAHEN